MKTKKSRFSGGTTNKIVGRAVNGARTRDLRLGKPTLCQLSYYRKRADTGTRTRDLFIANRKVIIDNYANTFP